MRQGKDTVVIQYRQQIFDSCLNPSFPGNMVTAGAVPVPAGVVSFFRVAASVADLPVGAELTAPAMFDIVYYFVLPPFSGKVITIGF